MELVGAFAAWLAVGVAPGYALARLLAPGLPRSLAAALAPAATWGILAPVLPALSATETAIPSWAAWVWAAVGLLSALAVEWWRRTGSFAVAGLRRAERWSLALGVALAAAIWFGAVRDWIYAPGDDAVQHALFAARVLGQGVVDPPFVTSPDLLAGLPGASFYPLTLHVQGAWMAALSGLPVAGAVSAVAIFTALWSLPLGVVWLCRVLLPTIPRAALLAPVAASCLATFPWGPVAFGGHPIVASASVVPAVVAAWLIGSRPLRVGVAVAAGVAAAGAVTAHTSTLALLGVLGLALVGWPPGVGVGRGDLLRSGIAVGAVAGLLLAPGVRQLLSAAEERFGSETPQQVDGLEALIGAPLGAYALVEPAASAVVLLLVGLVAGMRGPMRGWCVALLALWALEVAVGVAPSYWATALTSPWYSLPARLALHAGLVALPVLAFGGAFAWTWVERGLAARTEHVRVPTLVVGALGLFLAAWGALTSWQLLAEAESRTPRTGSGDLAAWVFLSSQIRPGERVLNDIRDGSPYLEVVHGVPVVFGVRTLDWATPKWADRLALLEHAEDIGRTTDIDATAAALNVRFVLAGDDGRTDGIGRRLPRQDLSAAPGLRLVFSRSGVEVYEVIRP